MRLRLRLRLPRVPLPGLAAAAGVVVVLSAALAWWAGFFDSVSIRSTEAGPYQLIYRQHRGPYQGVPVAIRDVAQYVRSRQGGADPALGFAIYYSDPAVTAAESLSCIAGCITDSLLRNAAQRFGVMTFERRPALVGTFRLRSFLSYMTGVLKFYPALRRRVAQEGLQLEGPVMEVYDLRQRQISYVAPLKARPDTTTAAP